MVGVRARSTRSSRSRTRTDPAAPDRPVDSHLRIGSSRRDDGPTRTDAEFVQHVLKAVPEDQRPAFSGDVTTLPAITDPLADVKRSLRYDAPTGFGIMTNGQLLKYLGGGEVTRVMDGSFRVYAVDQGENGPKLSYLRVGKPEQPLGTDADGNPTEGSGTPLPSSRTAPRTQSTRAASASTPKATSRFIPVEGRFHCFFRTPSTRAPSS